MAAVRTSSVQARHVVDRTSPLPVYFQIAMDIRDRVADGEWSSGKRIPPELVLAREYEVSRQTVRQAIAELVKDDLLERRRGSGTYVLRRHRPLIYDLNLTVGALASRWRDANFDNRAEVIEAGVLLEPPDELRHRLQIPRSGSAAYMVRRVFINDRPTVLYRSWFNGELVPGLESSPRLSGSLSTVLVEDYGLAPARSDAELEVVRPTREETSLLQVENHIPLVMITVTTYLGTGVPLEHAQLAWVGDRVRFQIKSQGGEAS
jgi:DNA-binding GntR family transcriptional regulator